jgi:hypothetical protein
LRSTVHSVHGIARQSRANGSLFSLEQEWKVAGAG